MDKKTIQNELRQHAKLDACARAFGVVGDLTRLKICWLLCRHPEFSVGDIADLLEMEISAVSHALAKLRGTGVVSSRRLAKRKLYALEKTPVSMMVKKALSEPL